MKNIRITIINHVTTGLQQNPESFYVPDTNSHNGHFPHYIDIMNQPLSQAFRESNRRPSTL